MWEQVHGVYSIIKPTLDSSPEGAILIGHSQGSFCLAVDSHYLQVFVFQACTLSITSQALPVDPLTLSTMTTVEPPNKGHFGANSFVLCIDVVPISEVK